MWQYDLVTRRGLPWLAAALVASGCAAEAVDASGGADSIALQLTSEQPRDVRALQWSSSGAGARRVPAPLSFETLFSAPLVVEGLVADARGQLYTAARGGDPCPVWRVDARGAGALVVGSIPAPCSANGLAFDAAGRLYVASTDKIYRLDPNEAEPPSGAVFVSGLAGSNGLAFDASGTLWVSDGASAQGRVWKVSSDAGVSVAFRVQPLASTLNVVEGSGGIGRDVRALPPGRLTITDTSRAAADTAGSQPVVANGLAFAADGSLFVSDTARGAIWKVRFADDGSVESSLGCDGAFPADTLCLEELFVAHPLLEGIDGIVLDRHGNLWGTAQERNALVRVTPEGKVREVFRNPMDPVTRLRNGGPLEFPTTPVLLAGRLCLAHSDQNRRDNSPNSAGEVGPGLVGLGKLSCSNEPVVTGATRPSW
jgi:sugar lactone lactonase YvrE